MMRLASAAGRALVLTAALASEPSHALQLLGVDTSGSESADFALPATPLATPVTQLRLRFDGPLPPLTAAAFRVIAAGSDRLLQTADCASMPQLDDAFVAIDDVLWNAAHNEIALRLDAPRGLARGRYRLIACATLPGLGADVLRDFSIEQTPALTNPGFDASLAHWTFTSAPGTSVVHDALADADEAPHSGAVRVVSSALSVGFGPTACFDLSALAGFNDADWRLRLRYRVLSGNVRINMFFMSAFAGDTPPFECIGPGIVEHVALNAAPTPGFLTFDSGWQPFLPMPNGNVSLFLVSRDGQPFEILLDDIGLRFDADIIFRDTFD